MSEEAMLKIIDQRDAAEDALALAYFLVTGKEALWSNLFGYDEAIHDIRAKIADMEFKLSRHPAERMNQ